jgi:Na+-translocating ferredoxin:NAD+ oxidoreductase RNF subunit RnfB
MASFIIPAAIMAGLGLFFATLLAVAYRYLRVYEDPRIEQVEELLPGSNCGACGEPGCHGFAEKLVAGDASPSKCTVSSPEGLDLIADFLGVDAGEQIKRVARLHCAGGRAEARQIAAYEGYSSCTGAHLVQGGGKGCVWGCLGLSDCEVVCTFDAIEMNANGLPVVDPLKCTACGDCVDACPRNLFEILPLSHALLVQCKATLAGEEAVALCTVACDACGRCAADAAPGLIHMENNLPIVDYSKGGPAQPEATFRCPTGAIQWVEGAQFSKEPPKPKAQSEKRYAALPVRSGR